MVVQINVKFNAIITIEGDLNSFLQGISKSFGSKVVGYVKTKAVNVVFLQIFCKACRVSIQNISRLGTNNNIYKLNSMSYPYRVMTESVFE